MNRTALVVLCSLGVLACSAHHVEARGELATVPDAGAQVAPNPNGYPATREVAVVDELFGTQVADPYRWLEDEKSPEVQAWMKAQDDFARARLAQLPGRAALAKRYRELYYQEALTPPLKRQGRYFYTRTHKDREKPIVYWRDGERGAEKVLLDPNSWSSAGSVSLGVWVPSWDGRKVVFAQHPNAADEAVLHVIDVGSGDWSKLDVIEGAKYAGPSWTPDSKGFYYEWLPTDPAIPVDQRPGYTELRYHKLSTDPKTDPVVHGKTGDPASFLGGGVSRDGKYLTVSIAHGWNGNDLYVKRLGKHGDKDFVLLAQGGSAAQYGYLTWKDKHYVVTDEGAPHKRVFQVDLAKPDRQSWKELIAEDPSAVLVSLDIVGGHFAALYLKNATSELRLYALDGKPVRTVQLPGLGSATKLGGLEDDDEAYYAFSSFTWPRQVFRTSVKSGKSSVWFKLDVPVDPTPYVVEQVRYPSKDGTLISMFLVRRKDAQKNGQNPVLLYGYGGFDVSITSSFSSFIYPWLEAGGIYASPNLRGGGEYGKAWHDAGKLDKKQNVFDDFAAAGEYLVKEGWTRPGKIAIRGGSNGGLLVGAAAVQRPDLWGAVLCAMPLLDMVRFPKFGSGRTWMPEYGDPERAADFAWIYPYSPYHHVKAAPLPAFLMMTADHDDRVDPMHARKFIAALQKAGNGGAPAWLRIESHAGHGGADMVKSYIESSADQLAFAMNALGMNPVPEASLSKGR